MWLKRFMFFFFKLSSKWIQYAPIHCRSTCGRTDGKAPGFSSIQNLQKAAFTLSTPVNHTVVTESVKAG